MEPNTRYRFIKETSLLTGNTFPVGHEFRTDDGGAFNATMPDKPSGETVELAILEVWLENGVIEDMNIFIPKNGDTMFYLNNSISTSSSSLSASISQLQYNENYNYFIKMGNCFRTRQDAEDAWEDVKYTLKSFYSK